MANVTKFQETEHIEGVILFMQPTIEEQTAYEKRRAELEAQAAKEAQGLIELCLHSHEPWEMAHTFLKDAILNKLIERSLLK